MTQSFIHPEYNQQYADWVKMEDLFLGSSTVKNKGDIYLPMTTLEYLEYQKNRNQRDRKTKYQFRLENAIYFNGVSHLTRFIMGHLYRVPPILDPSLEGIGNLVINADLLGNSLVDFMNTTSSWSYVQGHHFLMVDAPNIQHENRAEERMANPYPYLISVHPSEIVNWSVTKSVNGDFVFDWVIRRHTEYESDGPFSEWKEVTYYTIMYPGKWERYTVNEEVKGSTSRRREGENEIETKLMTESPVLVDEGENVVGVVPLVPIYSNPIRPMVSIPPLLESADLNLSHYQLLSNLNNGLMYHMNPLLVFAGATEDRVEVGASSAVMLPRNAEAKYVEFTGQSLRLALEEAEMVAKQMWESGMKSSAAVGVNTSGDARRIGRSDLRSWMERVASYHERGFDRALRIIAKWYGVDAPDTPMVQINRDFDLTPLEANQTEFLLNARKAGEISRETFLKELKRGEAISSTIDVPAEIERAKKDLEEDLEQLVKAEAAASAAQPEPAPNPQSDPGSREPRRSPEK